PGLLWAYRGCPKGVIPYGQPDASSGHVPPRIGMRDLAGAPVRWTLSNAPSNTFALVVLGLSNVQHGPLPLPAPLDPFGLPGITLLTSAELTGAAITGGGGANGYAQFDLSLPPG